MSNNEVTIKDVRKALDTFKTHAYRGFIIVGNPAISLNIHDNGMVVMFTTEVAHMPKPLNNTVFLPEVMAFKDIVALFTSTIITTIIGNIAFTEDGRYAVVNTPVQGGNEDVGSEMDTVDRHAYLRGSVSVMGKEREFGYNVSQPDKVIEHFLTLMRGAIVSHNEAVERMRPLVNNPTYIVDKTEYLPRKSGPHISLCVLTPNGTEHTHIAKLEALESYTKQSVIQSILIPVAMLYKANEKPSDQEVWFQKFWTALTYGVDRFNSSVENVSKSDERRVMFIMRDTTVYATDDGVIIKLAYVCNGQHAIEEVTMASYGDFTPDAVIRNLLQPVVESIAIENTSDVMQTATPTDELPMKDEFVFSSVTPACGMDVTENQTPVPTSIGDLDGVMFRNKFLESMRSAIAIINSGRDNPVCVNNIVFQDASFTTNCVDDRYQEVVINFSYFSLPGSKGNKTFVSIDKTVDYTVAMIVREMLPSIRDYLITGFKPKAGDWLGVLLNGPQTPPCGL